MFRARPKCRSRWLVPRSTHFPKHTRLCVRYCRCTLWDWFYTADGSDISSQLHRELPMGPDGRTDTRLCVDDGHLSRRRKTLGPCTGSCRSMGPAPCKTCFQQRSNSPQGATICQTPVRALRPTYGREPHELSTDAGHRKGAVALCTSWLPISPVLLVKGCSTGASDGYGQYSAGLS